jgi:hypothetical protein
MQQADPPLPPGGNNPHKEKELARIKTKPSIPRRKKEEEISPTQHTFILQNMTRAIEGSKTGNYGLNKNKKYNISNEGKEIRRQSAVKARQKRLEKQNQTKQIIEQQRQLDRQRMEQQHIQQQYMQQQYMQQQQHIQQQRIHIQQQTQPLIRPENSSLSFTFTPETTNSEASTTITTIRNNNLRYQSSASTTPITSPHPSSYNITTNINTLNTPRTLTETKNKILERLQKK